MRSRQRMKIKIKKKKKEKKRPQTTYRHKTTNYLRRLLFIAQKNFKVDFLFSRKPRAYMDLRILDKTSIYAHIYMEGI